jgi:anti-anti-sigma factor
MDIGGRQKHGFYIVDVIGKIDRLKDSMALRSHVTAIADGGGTHVAMNLAQVTYLDSGALNALIHCQSHLQKLGGKFVLISPGEYVSDVLRVVGFDRLITIYSSEKEFFDEAKKD